MEKPKKIFSTALCQRLRGNLDETIHNKRLWQQGHAMIKFCNHKDAEKDEAFA